MTEKKKTVQVAKNSSESTQMAAGETAKKYNELDAEALVDAFENRHFANAEDVYADDEEVNLILLANLYVTLKKDENGKWVVDGYEVDEEGYVEDLEEFLNSNVKKERK